MSTPIYQVDAFTDKPFAGNPAAVCFPSQPRSETWMQNVAREMNLSETAFLHPREARAARADGFDLRWFTPAVEVDLCGHATLASAHVLWETGRLNRGEQARFHTRSGLLTADRQGKEIQLDFPATPATPTEPPPGLSEALGASIKYIGRTQFDYLVEVASEGIVRDLHPDIARLKTLSIRGIMVTSLADSPGFDFVSRFFAPGAGIDEDPVTGSAHCCLGPYWQARLGQDQFLAYQASARGGVVRVHVAGERVLLGGRAVTVLRGELVEG
jgi:PhzF family phenazine biosynthesis protein